MSRFFGERNRVFDAHHIPRPLPAGRHDCGAAFDDDYFTGATVLSVPPNEAFLDAFQNLLTSLHARMHEVNRVENLEKILAEVNSRIEKLEKSRSFFMRLQTFAPEPFEVIKEINVTVDYDGEDYTASFPDANVNASGCNEAEAIENLKENILSSFEYLSSVAPEKLVKPLKKQIAVLQEFVRRKP